MKLSVLGGHTVPVRTIKKTDEAVWISKAAVVLFTTSEKQEDVSEHWWAQNHFLCVRWWCVGDRYVCVKESEKDRDLGHTGTHNCKINTPSLLKHQQIIKYFALQNLLRCSFSPSFSLTPLSMQINTLIIWIIICIPDLTISCSNFNSSQSSHLNSSCTDSPYGSNYFNMTIPT